ncbi:capsid assembly protein [Thalassospira profundimaris]|uniref:capsid assembly protein n=1 Tax=Thalassospira profundimaris TaxID=502049 RepID=UPI000DED64DC|nr:hypothetical protein [Thalassospira profundimaris]
MTDIIADNETPPNDSLSGGGAEPQIETEIPDPGPADAGLLSGGLPDDQGDKHDGNKADMLTVPASADDYAISVDDALGGMDPDLNKRLHQAGFNNAQAQLVYDLAGEILGPMMADMDQAAKRASDRAALITEFGGKDAWQALAPRIEQWGRANLPDAAFETLCQTRDGVMALHRLMTQAGEITLGRTNDADGSGDLRADIRAKMNDPRYWRDRDPALIAEVQAGFARLRGD